MDPQLADFTIGDHPYTLEAIIKPVMDKKWHGGMAQRNIDGCLICFRFRTGGGICCGGIRLLLLELRLPPKKPQFPPKRSHALVKGGAFERAAFSSSHSPPVHARFRIDDGKLSVAVSLYTRRRR